ncbi:helix-turn-helix domain-containing protein [Demequina sp.]|uniref:helix-turn-helix domain-containing protein n=1 Tax=Demequina sp. TaxID=2050685 RepID=UPI003A8653E0
MKSNARRTNRPTTPTNRKNLLTIKQTAEYVGYSERTVYNLINSGYLPAYKVRGVTGIRIRHEDAEGLLVPFRAAA